MKIVNVVFSAVLLMAAALGLFILSKHNYLLFHVLLELFSVVVGLGIFVVAWNSRKFSNNSYFLYIGIAYLFVAFIDLIHTLAFKGMGVFSLESSNPATQLWIAARFIEASTLAISPFFLKKRLNLPAVWAGYVLVSGLLLALIFTGRFPAAFIEGQGLTAFKIASEYVIMVLVALGIYMLYRKRDEFSPKILYMLMGSLGFTIVAEMMFTLYTDPFGLTNAAGHYFKLGSFILIYDAVVVTSLTKPYQSLFHDLKANERKLEGLIGMKNDFMSIAAHELKAPLTPIIGFSKLLMASPNLTADQKQQLNIIHDSAWRQKRLVDDVLDIVKLEGRTMNFFMDKMSMNEVISATVMEMQPLAAESKLKLVVDVQENLPIVYGDKERLHQVLRNLIGNSIKFTGKGNVKITVKKKGEEIIVAVQDTGCGISEGSLKKLFSKFYQAEDLEHQHKSKGTGLGLAISKQIIEQHNGKIWAESKGLGKGSKFCFSLPISESK